jgi:general secretion pathway protein C
MQDKFVSPRLALDQRTAQFEQVLRRFAVLLGKVPLERWKWLVTLLLVLWLSHSLARFFWLIVPAPAIPTATATAVVSSAGPVPGDAQSIDILALKESQVFGQIDQAAATEAAAATPAPSVIENDAVDTQLNLVLRGVIGSSDDASARAIIANGAEADVYAPGDELPVGRGVTLAKVLDLRVILNNNGRYESLWLYKDDPNARIATPYVPEQDASRSWPDENGNMDGNQGEHPQPLFVDKSPGYDSPSQDANPMGSADPSGEVARSLADVVAMSIHREGGQVVGYKIRPGRNAEQFTALGLQSDDIVTAVNGVPLTSPGKVMEIYKNMSNATSASLEIKRGGSVLSVDVVLQ